MNINNLIVDLEPREDSKKNIYFLGRLKFPGTIDLSEGITILVFMSESGDEELQIAVNDKDNTAFSKFVKKRDRLEIRLEDRPDRHGAKFFVAKVLLNAYIRCNNEVVFLVFISREGQEEIQIVGEIISNSEKHSDHRGIEVIRKRPINYSND